ncbi:HlyD family efflux transporter periplasmic adaptor subunit [Vibrio fluvialis]|nr:HlyD family efflux transporter periplasmic adaptor subunit [Vibrio fluvialis]
MVIGVMRPRDNKEKKLLSNVFILFSFGALAVLLMGKYADKIDVKGEVKINNSVLLFSESSGIVDKVYVNTGDRVKSGDLVFKIKNTNLNYTNNESVNTLKEQIDDLNVLISKEREVFLNFEIDKKSEIENKLNYIDLIKSEQSILKDSIVLIESDLKILNEKLERFKLLKKSGAISKDTYLDVALQLSQSKNNFHKINIEMASKSKEIVSIADEISKITTSIEDAKINHLRQIDNLIDRKNKLERSSGYFVLAPIDGFVSYSLVSENQVVSSNEQLGTITVGLDPDVYVQLYTDSQAMSYLGENEEVVIRVDAFPYEKFGVLKGRVLSVSPTKVKNSKGEDVFNVLVNIPHGNNHISLSSLNNSMSVTATYSGPELTLIEWLFLPVVKGVHRNPNFWSNTQ